MQRIDCALREVRDSDGSFFYDFQADPEAAAMAGVVPRDRDAFERNFPGMITNAAITWRTIVVGDAVAGCVMSRTTEGGQREVGYWVARQFWAGGVATASLAAFLAIESARPIQALVAVHNVGSARVLEKNGFTLRGEEDGFKVFKLD